MEAFDTVGSQTVTIMVSVDGTSAEIERNWSRVLQHFSAVPFMQGTFIVLYIYSFGVMLLLPGLLKYFWTWRGYALWGEDDVNQPEEHNKHFTGAVMSEIIKKIEVYGSLTRLNWWAMFIFWVNLAVGPLVIGPIVSDSNYGVGFLWGGVADVSDLLLLVILFDQSSKFNHQQNQDEYNFTVEVLLSAWLVLFFLYIPTLQLLMAIDYSTLKKTRLVTVGAVFYLVCFLVFGGFFLFVLIFFETWSGFLLSPLVTWFIVVSIALIIRGVVRRWRAQQELQRYLDM